MTRGLQAADGVVVRKPDEPLSRDGGPAYAGAVTHSGVRHKGRAVDGEPL